MSSNDDEAKVASHPPPPHMDGESSSDAMLRRIMAMMEELQQGNAQLKEELKQDNTQLKGEMTKFQSKVESDVRRISRRQSGMLPIPGPATPLPSPPPQVSAMTNSAYAHLRTPVPNPANQRGNRQSAGARPSGGIVYEEEGSSEEEDAIASGEEEEVNESQRKVSGEEEEKEATKLAKVMSKRAAPTAFFGEKEAERENVESWVTDADDYLESQFGQLKGQHLKERLQLIRSYIKGAAANWINAAVKSDPNQTWETLRIPFTEFIRGGRESRSLYLERMKTLTYGKGNCKDLLKLEQEFEQLRIKLYPTSSTVAEANEIVGREYAEAIRRGDLDLYLEMLRVIGGKDQPTLSEWKAAAVRAQEVRALQAFAKKQQGDNNAGRQRWANNNRFGGLSAQEMNTYRASC